MAKLQIQLKFDDIIDVMAVDEVRTESTDMDEIAYVFYQVSKILHNAAE